MEKMEKIRADKMTIDNSVSKNPRKDQNELANQQYCNNIITRGGFPIEIKTKIRYLKICCYLYFIKEIKITT